MKREEILQQISELVAQREEIQQKINVLGDKLDELTEFKYAVGDQIEITTDIVFHGDLIQYIIEEREADLEGRIWYNVYSEYENCFHDDTSRSSYYEDITEEQIDALLSDGKYRLKKYNV